MAIVTTNIKIQYGEEVIEKNLESDGIILFYTKDNGECRVITHNIDLETAIVNMVQHMANLVKYEAKNQHEREDMVEFLQVKLINAFGFDE